jgi:hypothetical protein
MQETTMALIGRGGGGRAFVRGLPAGSRAKVFLSDIFLVDLIAFRTPDPHRRQKLVVDNPVRL